MAHMGEERGMYRVLVGRPRHRWVGNIRTSPGGGMWVYGLVWAGPG